MIHVLLLCSIAGEPLPLPLPFPSALPFWRHRLSQAMVQERPMLPSGLSESVLRLSRVGSLANGHFRK